MYQASSLQQLVVEEHSGLEWSEEGTHTYSIYSYFIHNMLEKKN